MSSLFGVDLVVLALVGVAIVAAAEHRDRLRAFAAAVREGAARVSKQVRSGDDEPE